LIGYQFHSLISGLKFDSRTLLSKILFDRISFVSRFSKEELKAKKEEEAARRDEEAAKRAEEKADRDYAAAKRDEDK
jgi:hypothetical protein